MRKTLTTVTLVLALSCPAWAGIMHTPDSPAPPSQPAGAAPEPEPQAATENGAQGTYAHIALELLAVLRSIL